MSLAADPSQNFSTFGNVLAAYSLASSGTHSVTVDFSSATLGGFVQVQDVTTSVSTTTGVLVQAFATSDGSTYDTIAWGGVNFVLAPAASSTGRQSFYLPTGRFQILLSNQDTTYGVTINMTSSTVT